jgi:limonene-1,2-epoxide hydrolase
METERAAFRKAVEARDMNGMVSAFAEDAVLHSPITFKPFEGREAIATLLGILMEVFEEFHYTDQLEAGDGTLGLVFRARVGTREVEGLDLLRFNADGSIRDFTVMVRPRSAVEALLSAVGGRLAQSSPGG